MLGFNDMGWFYSDAFGTLDSIHTLITNARAANPNIKIAVADVPQRSSLGPGRADLPIKTNTYNALLPASIPFWTTSQSPIELVQLRENYQCEPASCLVGYDGLHPNARGEYQIAQAFSLTLVNGFGLGSSPIAIPGDIPPRPIPVPTNFNVTTSPGGILATWDAVYGAYSYDVRSRIEGITDWAIGSVGANQYDATWTVDGLIYDIQIRVNCGDAQQGDWTSIGTATAHPQTAPGVSDILTPSILVSLGARMLPYLHHVSNRNGLYADYRLKVLTTSSSNRLQMGKPCLRTQTTVVSFGARVHPHRHHVSL